MNRIKTQGLWREEGIRVPQTRRLKRRGSSTSEVSVTAAYPCHVRAIDFQADHLKYGTGFNIASIIDEHTGLVLEGTVIVLIAGEDLGDILERLALTHGMPAILRMDT